MGTKLPLLSLLSLVSACAATPLPTTTAPVQPTAPPDAGPPPHAPSIADAPPRAESGRLTDVASPLAYELSLDVDPTRPTFSGVQKIRLRITRPTFGFVLNAQSLTVSRVGLDGRASAGSAFPRPPSDGHGATEEIVVAFDTELTAGEHVVELAFEGRFDPGIRGLYRVQQQGQWYAYTQFEPNDARRAFPCFDEPAFKVPWTVSVQAPAGSIAVANMPEASRTGGLFAFAPTPPTSSYLIALGVGPFDVVEHAPIEVPALGGEPARSVPLRGITTRGNGALARTSLDAAADQVVILARYFDRTFPYPKLDIVAVPEFGAGAMENPGFITFREELILMEPSRAPIASQRAMASVMAHELAHHWFGDLVTMRWWNDLWLNEGFATWATPRVLDTWRPALNARIEALRGRTWAMEQDSLPTARVVRQPVRTTSEAEEAFDGITYVKGASVVRMVEQWLGEEAFRDGVRQYLRAAQWSNATADDWLTALSRVSQRDVAAVAGTFLDQRGVPLVSVEAVCAAGAPPKLRLSQSMYRVVDGSTAPAGASPRWQIPVCFTFDNGTATAGNQCTLLTEPTAEVALTGATRCPRWVHPNATEAGYYRYALTAPVRALFAPARYRALDVRDRIGLFDDAWAMVRSGTLPAADYLALVEGARSERDRLVLESISQALWTLTEDFADDATRARLRAYVARFFGPIARELGWTAGPRDDDDRKLLRRSVLSTMGNLALDPATLVQAEQYTNQYLADRQSVPMDIAALALPMASRRSNGARLDALIAALRRDGLSGPERSMLQGALVTFTDEAVLRRALDATLAEPVRVQDALRLVYGAAGAVERRRVVWQWAMDHFEAVRARIPGDAVGRLGGLTGGTCDAESRTRLETFFRPLVTPLDGGARGLSEALDRSRQCEALGAGALTSLRAWRGRLSRERAERVGRRRGARCEAAAIAERVVEVKPP